jgi:uncharacterized membrane protein YdbT with pleckstrin-like domain
VADVADVRMTEMQETEPEQVIARFRSHGRRLVGPALLAVLVCALTGYFAGRLPEQWMNQAVLVLAALLVLAFSVVPLVSWLAHRYVLTTRRIILRRGLFVNTRRDFLLHRGIDISLERRGLQLLFRSGEIRIEGGQGVTVVLHDVPSADLVLQAILDLSERRPREPVEPTPAVPRPTGQNPWTTRGETTSSPDVRLDS